MSPRYEYSFLRPLAADTNPIEYDPPSRSTQLLLARANNKHKHGLQGLRQVGFDNPPKLGYLESFLCGFYPYG